MKDFRNFKTLYTIFYYAFRIFIKFYPSDFYFPDELLELLSPDNIEFYYLWIKTYFSKKK